MTENRVHVSMNQSTHKAWAGGLISALVPVITALSHWALGEPIPEDVELAEAMTDLGMVLVQALIFGGLGYGAVYRTTNYHADSEAHSEG